MKNVKEQSLKKLLYIVMVLSLILSMSSINVYASEDVVNTDMNSLKKENFAEDSDLYKYLESVEQYEKKPTPRITNKMEAWTSYSVLSPYYLYVSYKNVGIDTVDTVTVVVDFYNDNGTRIASSTRPDYNIKPLKVYTEEYYIHGFRYAVGSIYYQDGKDFASAPFSFTRPN